MVVLVEFIIEVTKR